MILFVFLKLNIKYKINKILFIIIIIKVVLLKFLNILIFLII